MDNLTVIKHQLLHLELKFVAYDLSGNRPSWAPNGEKGWTTGPSQEHYRYIRCFFTKTRAERDVNTQGLQSTFQKLTLISIVIYGEFEGVTPH